MSPPRISNNNRSCAPRKKGSAWKVTKVDDGYKVSGRKIERFAVRAHSDTEEGQRRLRDIMKKMGIMHHLDKQGIMPGQRIHIGSICTLEY